MDNIDIFQNDYKNKILILLDNNKDKQYLKGFYNFINKSKSNSTVYNYLLYITAFMNYNNKKIEDLELDDYTEYLSTLENKSSSYKITVYSAMKNFSKYLKASNKNDSDPMQYIDRPKYIELEETKEKRENGYLEPREIKKLLRSIDNGVGNKKSKSKQKDWKDRDKAIIYIFLSTGMRCSALYKLNLDSIDFDKKVIRVIDKGSKYKEYNVSDELLMVISKWLIRRKTIVNNETEEALFLSNQKTRMKQHSIYNVVNKYASVIDGKNITPHKLRATYGTQLYKKTGDLYLVQECMGHSNPKTTELYIRGQKNEATQKASDIMTKLIF